MTWGQVRSADCSYVKPIPRVVPLRAQLLQLVVDVRVAVADGSITFSTRGLSFAEHNDQPHPVELKTFSSKLRQIATKGSTFPLNLRLGHKRSNE
eukprot:6450770-Amphidinium_carterae.1